MCLLSEYEAIIHLSGPADVSAPKCHLPTACMAAELSEGKGYTSELDMAELH